jgi:NAD(P)-dependent dehydrogenase (short-subunit alcohol dehydrogenase family)
MNTTPAIVTGVGPGTERSAVQRLTQGRYEMAMGATSEERLRQFEADIPGSRAFPADVTNASEFIDALDQISADFGAPEVVIYNAVGGVFGNFMQIDPAILELNFQIDVMTFLHLVRRLAPAMVEAGQGVIIASGNTSALRGKVISRVLLQLKQRSESLPNPSRVSSVHGVYTSLTSSSTRLSIWSGRERCGRTIPAISLFNPPKSLRRFGTLCIGRRAHGRSMSRFARSKKLGAQQ